MRTEKECTKCKEELPLDDFYFDKRTDKPRGRCKACACEEDKVRYKRNGKTYSASKRRERTLREGYGLTLAEYDDMLEEQSGKCAICEEYPKSKALAVDHNHDTGKVRGLLCSNCNTGIGLLGDSLYLIKQAGIYLEENDG